MDIHPLTPERWDDLETLFGKQGAYYGCWCMHWRILGKDFQNRTAQQNKADFQQIVESGRVPGLLAYEGEKPVGWCCVAPREEFPRFNPRAQVYKPIDDQLVWSIVCFYIHAQHRGQGVATALLNFTIPFAAERGAPMLEAYPRVGDSRMSDSATFTGTLSMFLSAGFEEAARPHATRAIVRRKL
jgi:GNAT superfamily N-acetyltransferase